MDREIILSRVQAHRPKLAEFGVASLALFGSMARGDAGDTSDVDFLVSFEGPATFDRYMDLKLFLEDLLERRVDLVTERGLRDEVRPFVERELLRVA